MYVHLRASHHVGNAERYVGNVAELDKRQMLLSRTLIAKHQGSKSIELIWYFAYVLQSTVSAKNLFTLSLSES